MSYQVSFVPHSVAILLRKTIEGQICASNCSTASETSTDGSDGESTDHTLVLPSSEEVQQVFARSKQIWYKYVETAKSLDHIPQHCLSLSHIAKRLPAMPEDLRGVSTLLGQSTWMLSGATNCPLVSKTTAPRRWKPILASNEPTRCQFSSTAPFSSWQRGLHGREEPYEHNNGTAILFAGWVYLLAKKLLEKQGLSMQYSGALAPVIYGDQELAVDERSVAVEVGDVCPSELKWWRALLSTGQGWSVPTTQQPPWSITFEGAPTFVVAATTQNIEQSSSFPPPSSIEAARFLDRFISRFNLGMQSSAALAMAVMLPLLNCSRSTVQLQTPKLGKPRDPQVAAPETSQLSRDYENISKYMTLSSNPRFLSSALWSTFWEAGIDCSLVSPWCDGIIENLMPLFGENVEVLAHTLAIRRPNLAPLWYGTLMFGWTNFVQTLIPFLKSQNAPTSATPISEVALWTDSPQSYMDICGAGSYVQENDTISRADAWRLRHDCWDREPDGIQFRNTPLLGWPPFGVMRICDLELEVRVHANCQRHRWQYDHWTWQLDDTRSLRDDCCQGQYMYEESDVNWDAIYHADLDENFNSDHKATATAVRIAFRWAASEIDYKSREVFSHPWIGATTYPSQNDTYVDSPTRNMEEIQDRVAKWLQSFKSNA